MRKNTQRQRQRTVQSKWLADFSCLLLDFDSVSYYNICRKYSDFADLKSLMFIGKIVDKNGYLSPHQSSAKNENTTKTKKPLLRLIKMKLIDRPMRIFFQQLILYLKTTTYSLTAHSYLKSKFKMVLIWAVIT